MTTETTLERPTCPRCGKADRVVLRGEPSGPVAPDATGFCNRCMGNLEGLDPLDGRAARILGLVVAEPDNNPAQSAESYPA